MIFRNHALCLEATEYIRTGSNPGGIVPEGTYYTQRHRGNIVVHGRGGNGRGILVEFESLPTAYRKMVIDKYGDPYTYAHRQAIINIIVPDHNAHNFFAEFRKDDGNALSENLRIKYANNCSILNAFQKMLRDKQKLKSSYHITIESFWHTAAEVIKHIEITNSLPTSVRRLRQIYREYSQHGYPAIISKKIGNENSKKVTVSLERLILSIYVSGKPYATDVCEAINQFFDGKIEVVDQATGELFNPADFMDGDDQMNLSRKTVWSYINKPDNRVTVDKVRVSGFEFNNRVAPHNHRCAPSFAFSKISMDDLELPFLLQNGDRVKAYQIVDVASGCIIGKSFGHDKNRGLFLEAVKDMFRLASINGFRTPAEIEVEHNISSTFREDLLKPSNVFPFVHFCRPRNPQEKRAEHIFKGKKYGLQKLRPGFQGRWYGRLEATRPNADKVVRYSFEDIVANELADIDTWNNQLHPSQNKYPGLTRWQVLCLHQNPELVPLDLRTVARYVGNCTVTSIKRSKYVTVQHNEYSIPHPTVLGSLLPGDYQVNAYYIPTESGNIETVHLYQGDKFICSCMLSEQYNEAFAERTEKDNVIRQNQSVYNAQFQKMVTGGLSNLTAVKIEYSDTLNSIIQSVPELGRQSCDTSNNIISTPERETANQEINGATDMPVDYTDPAYWINKAKEEL